MTDTPKSGGRFALIVAVSDYRDPKLRRLRAPAADAKRLAAVLRNPDIGAFEVSVALDEEQPQLCRRLARFFSNRRPEDVLLVHFSCHGVKDESGELYLAAKDTELGYMLSATGVSSAWLREQIDRSRSKRIVVLLDCCYSGSAPFGMRSRAGENVNLRDHLEGRGRVVITASNATEYSYEGDQVSGEGQPSIFTDAVVEGLETGRADRDGDRWISVDELYDYVYDRVKDRTPNQNPNKLSTIEGPLHIAHSIYEPPVEPAELHEELIALTEHPVTEARLGAVDALAKLLESSNKGVALAARQTLERMLDDDSKRVARRASEALGNPATHDEQRQPSIEGEKARPRAETGPAPEEAAFPEPAPSSTTTVEGGDARARGSFAGLAGFRVAGMVAVGGAIMVIASISLHEPLPLHRARAPYQIPIAVMSAGVILLVAVAWRSDSGAPLLLATGLAFTLLGVTLPMSWAPSPLPNTLGFWLGALGAAAAAAGAAFALRVAHPGAAEASGAAVPAGARAPSVVAAVTGPAIVIVSFFVLPEWSGPGYPPGTTWDNWKNDAVLRYPASTILLCVVSIALAVAGIWLDRRRLLVMATCVACLTLGEAVPLIYTGDPSWGSGRWLRIFGAVLGVAGMTAAARFGGARTSRAAARSQRAG